MKKMIIGITTAVMLAGASVYATNSINNKSETKECKKESCTCPLCDGDCCCCGSCCSK